MEKKISKPSFPSVENLLFFKEEDVDLIKIV
jgi:hypothetical protein